MKERYKMKNILQVETLSKLSMDIYQNDSCIKDEKMANEILESMIEQLGIIAKFMEWIDFNDFINDINDNHLSNLWDEIDLYQIGDVINLLDSMKVKALNKDEQEDYLEFF